MSKGSQKRSERPVILGQHVKSNKVNAGRICCNAGNRDRQGSHDEGNTALRFGSLELAANRAEGVKRDGSMARSAIGVRMISNGLGDIMAARVLLSRRQAAATGQQRRDGNPSFDSFVLSPQAPEKNVVRMKWRVTDCLPCGHSVIPSFLGICTGSVQ
jgi:hypothetical protein